MSKEELNLDYQAAYDVWKDTMKEGNYLLAVKSALEKQIPKKPNRTDWIYCPNCNAGIAMRRGEQFCFCCGQRIDWSDSK